MKRPHLLNLIEAAFAAGKPAYARQAAQRYLVDWPGDLDVQLALARACAAEGDADHAARLLETLTAADPEDFAAQRLLGAQLLALGRAAHAAHAYACAHIGDGLGAPRGLPLPEWAAPVRAACLAGRIGDWETARRESESALEADTPSPLPSLVHLCSLWQAGQLDLARPLAEGFHARWPRAIAFRLCLAECLIAGAGGEGAESDQARALELLHDAAAQDLTGRVAARHWGDYHPYRALWQADAGALDGLPGPLPAELIEALGLNRLPTASSEASPTQSDPTPAKEKADVSPASARASAGASEEVARIQAQLDVLAERLRAKASHLQLPPTRLHYLILTSRTRLHQVFGLSGFTAIDGALKTLAARTEMKTHVLYVDDPLSLKPFGQRPVNPANAWDIKTLVGEIALRLQARNDAVGALLIVGGPDIIPFHHLPNPTDDTDPDIPSDNPYATADENYFVPEWPVGRIPSGAGDDPAPLLRALRIASGAPGSKGASVSRHWLARLWSWLSARWRATSARRSFGYTAHVWKRASAAVYTAIGDPRELLSSPPLDANALPAKGLAPSRLSYFNLHGIEDGPEWYGQRSPDDHGPSPEYPIALRPADVVNSGRAPVIVFSEACFGGNVIGKGVGDALCLRFLDTGARAVIGSTKIAYGSVTPPLIGADLLGRCFWQNVSAGLPVGEALRRAKLQMAQEMHARQGFLDGEDQKTLISFVLYGDPLFSAPGASVRRSAKLTFPKPAAPPPTVCDRTQDDVAEAGDITPEVVARIKAVVAQYLPGMGDAEWRVSRAHAECLAKGHQCPTAHLAARIKSPARLQSDPHMTVVTLSKSVRVNAHTHPHYARLTLDAKGSIIKLAVSR